MHFSVPPPACFSASGVIVIFCFSCVVVVVGGGGGCGVISFSCRIQQKLGLIEVVLRIDWGSDKKE